MKTKMKASSQAELCEKAYRSERWLRIRRFLLVVATLMLILGCSKSGEDEAAKIVIRSGDSQCGFQGEELKDELIVEVMGPRRPSGWGSEVSRPAENVKVRVEALRPNGNGTAEPTEGVTDVAGLFRCKLRLGMEFGDQYYRVSCPDFPQVDHVLVHAVSGVEIQNSGQEVLSGTNLPRPIVIVVKERAVAEGELKALNGIPVYIKQVGGKEATLNVTQGLTNEKGELRLNIGTADGHTGTYDFMVELGDGHQYQDISMKSSESRPAYRSRGIKVRVLALSRWGIVIGVLGGLGIFIFGMTMMSNGLQQIAGERLKTLLQLFAGTRLKAVLAGLVVTSLIQSSSATTVMVVGFVNAQLLNLVQSIGIIYGAAIGTTVTAQMVSFKLDGLALPAICIGVITLMTTSKSHWRGIGNTLLGFGLLFFGMKMMSSEMKVLADFPGFMAFFNTFDCAPQNGVMPFGAILGAVAVGTILTVIIQSSSATVGMTIALAEAGLLNFYTAVPLILGDNIGTTITGHLAALGSSRNAKQVAMAATVFKMFGVMVMLPLFYVNWNDHPCFMELVNQMTAGDVFGAHHENVGRHLANAHTIFNLINVLLFIPLTGFVAKISVLLVPEKKVDQEEEKHLCSLESHLLNTPSAALDQVVTALGTMTEYAISLTQDATKAFLALDTKAKNDLDKRESKIDEAQKDIINYLVKLTRRNLTENQSATIPLFMHCVNDVERIGDRAINIYELIQQMPTIENGMIDAKSMDEKSLAQAGRLSDLAVSEINEICTLIGTMAEALIYGLRNDADDAYNKVVQYEVDVKNLTSRFERNHEARLQKQDCTVQKGVVFVEILANMERISAHLTNLAERAREMSKHRMSFYQTTK